MKRYLVLLAYEPGDWESASAEEQQGYADAHPRSRATSTSAAASSGRRRSRTPTPRPRSATSTAVPVVSDGPYVETVEIVGGYYDVELPDLDTAIAAARLLPAAYAVEIRPTVTIEGYEHPR